MLLGFLRTARLLFVLFTLVAIPSKGTSQVNWGTKFDALVGKSGITVEEKIDYDGRPMRVFHLPEAVQIRQRLGADGSVSTTSHDPAGAVGCMAMMIVEIDIFLSQCPGFVSADMSEAVDEALIRFREFSISNSYGLMTESDWAEGQKRSAEWYRKHRRRNPSDYCTSSETAKAIRQFIDRSADDFREMIDKVLKINRYPAMSPCL